ncbi:MAG: CPBP family intramembrane metalloprotease [Clostridia bacterium]|nr:CPBP family intramembrane metalloprotease [Clostridia bacterium]
MDKKEIKKDLNRLYICFSFVVILMIIISILYSLVLGIVISPSIYRNLDLIETTFGDRSPTNAELLELLFGVEIADISIQLAQVVVSIATFSIAFLIYYFIAIQGKHSIKNYCLIKKPNKKGWISDIFICYFIMFAVNYFQSVFFEFLGKVGIKIDDVPIDAPKTLIGTIISFIALCVLPAVLEELVFRGSAFGALKKYGGFAFIFISSISFSLMHSRIAQFPFALAGGIIISYLCLKYNSIIVCMIFHFTSNFLSFIQLVLNERGPFLSKIGMMIPFLFAVTGLLFFFVKCNKGFDLKDEGKGLKPSEIAKIMLTSGGFYGFLICCIISTAVNKIWA